MSRSRLTVPLAEVIRKRIKEQPEFGRALLEEAAQSILNGELDLARNIVRDVIKGTIGYAELGRRTGTPEKSLVRMFGPNGNPTASNISNVFVHLQEHGRFRLKVTSVPVSRKKPVKRAVARHVA